MKNSYLKFITLAFLPVLLLLCRCTPMQTAESQFKLANEKYKNGENYDALDAYNKAIKLKPDFYQAYNNRGSLKSKMGDKRGAIDDFSKAISLKPEFTDAYYNRGSRYYEVNERLKACADWKRAAELGHKEAGDAYQQYCK